MKIQPILESLMFNPHKYNSFKELTETDLFEIAKWGLLNDFNSSGAWDCGEGKDGEDELNSAVLCVVDSFKHLLKDRFPEGFNGIPNKIIIYRLVGLESRTKLNKKHLGYSWFANIDRLNEPDFTQQLFHLSKPALKQEGKKLYLLTAEISENKIDIPRTLFQRDLVYLENEIVLKDDANINLLSIKEI